MSKGIPSDYFDKLKNKIQENIVQLEDDVKNNAPTLYSIDKESMYAVPPDYFQGLTQKVMVRTKVVSNKSRIVFLRTIGIAASMMLLATFVYFGMFDINKSNDLDLAEAEIIDYYIDNPDELDYYLLDASLIEDKGIFEDLETGVLEEYLSSEIDDISISDLGEIANF